MIAAAASDPGRDAAGAAARAATSAQDVVVVVHDARMALRLHDVATRVLPRATLHLASAPDEMGALLVRLHPALVLVDLDLGDLAPADLAAKVRALNPRARLIVIAGHGDDDRLLPALRGGAAGFLFRHDSVDELAAQLHAAVSGAVPLTAPLARQLIREADRAGSAAGLARTDWEVLAWIAAGDSLSQCAGRLRVSATELLRQVERILGRMGLHALIGSRAGQGA